MSSSSAKTRGSVSMGKFCSKENIDTSSNSTGGICLHVANKTVSLEFCAECSKKAVKGRQNAVSRERKVIQTKDQVQV